MSPTRIEDYRRWFQYEIDSHAKVLESLEAVSESLRPTEGFQKAVTLMAHIVAARQLWLFRMGEASQAPRLEDFFPKDMGLDELRKRLDGVHASWSAFLARLDDSAIARSFEYQSLDGPWFRNTVADVLTQLYGHSLYHRGQIALLLRSIGAEPVSTDFVYWTREPIAAPAPGS